jgi:electron transfer flavoprotein alpha subunit
MTMEATTPGEVADPRIWVVAWDFGDDALGRLADARELADRMGVEVAVLHFDSGEVALDAESFEHRAQAWFFHGADHLEVRRPTPSANSGRSADAGPLPCEATLDEAANIWETLPPRLVLCGADRDGRAWAARLAARMNWQLVSPALLVQRRGGQLAATALDGAGRRARTVLLADNQPAIVALRPGVCQPLPPVAARMGSLAIGEFAPGEQRSRVCEHQAADPASADIRHLPRLVAGGRGVGGRQGFDRLRRIAERLDAGVAASRMAVDLGWIEYPRQVGQTGKTVRPELYLACGISGASHHWEGMSQSRAIVAVNTDASAPLMSKAHLAIVGDLHAVLMEVDRLLGEAPKRLSETQGM